MQIEPIDARLPLLDVEVQCLAELNAQLPESTNFVCLLRNGATPNFTYMLMTLAGWCADVVKSRPCSNLRDVKKQTRHDRMSACATLTIGRRMLRAVQAMHEIGWIHRSVAAHVRQPTSLFAAT